MSDTPNWNDINKALREPFDPSLISFRAQGTPNGGKAEVLAYIDARDVQDRLDEAVGAGNWSYDWEPINLDSHGDITLVKGKLTIHGVTKCDVGDRSSFSPSKGAVSDALKRAAAQWGIARYLYDLPKTYAPVEGKGRISPAALAQLRAKLPKPGNIAGRAQFDESTDEASETATTAKATPHATTEQVVDPALDERLAAILKRNPDLNKTYIEAKKYGLTGNEFFRIFINVTGFSKKELLEKPLTIAQKERMRDYVANEARKAQEAAARTPDLASVATPEVRP